MKKNWLKARTLGYTIGLLLMVGAVGLMTGCGDMATGPNSGSDDPVVVGNTGKGQGGNTVNNDDVTQTGLLGDVANGLLNVVEETVTKVVGRVGGTLSTDLTSGQTKFVVPFGALNGPVQIELEATQVKVGGQYFTVYEFGPHGLEFNRATKLSLSLPYADGTLVTFRWFNPETNQWEVQDKKEVRNGKVEFSVHHFSKYGIS